MTHTPPLSTRAKVAIALSVIGAAAAVSLPVMAVLLWDSPEFVVIPAWLALAAVASFHISAEPRLRITWGVLLLGVMALSIDSLALQEQNATQARLYGLTKLAATANYLLLLVGGVALTIAIWRARSVPRRVALLVFALPLVSVLAVPIRLHTGLWFASCVHLSLLALPLGGYTLISELRPRQPLPHGRLGLPLSLQTRRVAGALAVIGMAAVGLIPPATLYPSLRFVGIFVLFMLTPITLVGFNMAYRPRTWVSAGFLILAFLALALASIGVIWLPDEWGLVAILFFFIFIIPFQLFFFVGLWVGVITLWHRGRIGGWIAIALLVISFLPPYLNWGVFIIVTGAVTLFIVLRPPQVVNSQ